MPAEKLSRYSIIIPSGLKPRPDKYELSVAEACTKWFGSDIQFVPRSNKTTPDIVVLATHQDWEIKNIRGNSKYTIEDNLRKASRQSEYVIVSLLKPTKMTPAQALARIKFFLANDKRNRLKGVLLLTKQGTVIDAMQ